MSESRMSPIEEEQVALAATLQAPLQFHGPPDPVRQEHEQEMPVQPPAEPPKPPPLDLPVKLPAEFPSWSEGEPAEAPSAARLRHMQRKRLPHPPAYASFSASAEEWAARQSRGSRRSEVMPCHRGSSAQRERSGEEARERRRQRSSSRSPVSERRPPAPLDFREFHAEPSSSSPRSPRSGQAGERKPSPIDRSAPVQILDAPAAKEQRSVCSQAGGADDPIGPKAVTVANLQAPVMAMAPTLAPPRAATRPDGLLRAAPRPDGSLPAAPHLAEALGHLAVGSVQHALAVAFRYGNEATLWGVLARLRPESTFAVVPPDHARYLGHLLVRVLEARPVEALRIMPWLEPFVAQGGHRNLSVGDQDILKRALFSVGAQPGAEGEAASRLYTML